MTITFATETVDEVRGDIEPLLELHYEELCQHKEAMELAPDWDRYYALEQANRLLAFTARDDGVLIGYAVFFVDVHIHYKGMLTAMNDVTFVHRDYRSKTRAGLNLIAYSEHELKKVCVKVKVIWHIKFKLDWSPILLRRGYTPEDFTVSKIL